MGPKRVGIVEDNAPDAMLIAMALEKSDVPLERTVIADGEDARRNLESCVAGRLAPPDLLLLDLHLPKVSGADLLKLVHGSAALARVRLGVLSSLPHVSDRIRLRPGDRYIQKTPRLEEFIESIVSWVHVCTNPAG